jgi:excisionase family DNA binding protein
VTVREAAEQLEVSPQLVYALVAAGKLGCVRIGLGRGTIRILDEHIAAYLAGATPAAKTLSAPPPNRQVRLKHLRRA